MVKADMHVLLLMPLSGITFQLAYQPKGICASYSPLFQLRS